MLLSKKDVCNSDGTPISVKRLKNLNAQGAMPMVQPRMGLSVCAMRLRSATYASVDSLVALCSDQGPLQTNTSCCDSAFSHLLSHYLSFGGAVPSVGQLLRRQNRADLSPVRLSLVPRRWQLQAICLQLAVRRLVAT